MEGNGGKIRLLRPWRRGWVSWVLLVLALAIGEFLAHAGAVSAWQAAGTNTPGGRSSDAQVKAAAASSETYQLPPERYQKAVSLARQEYTLYFVAVAWGILVLLVLLQTGVVARSRDAPKAPAQSGA